MRRFLILFAFALTLAAPPSHAKKNDGNYGGDDKKGPPSIDELVRSAKTDYQRAFDNGRAQHQRLESLQAELAAGEDPKETQKEIKQAEKATRAADKAVLDAAKRYVDTEKVYHGKKGTYYNSEMLEEAQGVLYVASTLGPKPLEGVLDPEKPKLDANGIPIVDGGHKVSDNTAYSGEAADAVAKLGPYGQGTRAGNQSGSMAGDQASALSSGGEGAASHTPLGEDPRDSGAIAFGGSGYGASAGRVGPAGGAIGAPAMDDVRQRSSEKHIDGLRARTEKLGSEGERRAEVIAALGQGQDHLRFGEFNQALIAAERAIALDPTNSAAYQLKADALNRLGRFQEAEMAARAVLKLAPEASRGYEALAWSLLNMKRYDEALAAAKAAVAMDAKNAAAWAMAAFAYEKLGDREKMLDALANAARLDPKRYSGLLARARAGNNLFTPGEKDNWQLVYDVEARGGGGLPWPVFGGLALLAAAAGLAAAAYRRSRQVAAEAVPAAAVSAEPEADLLAGKYRLERVIGRGGMGQVWQGMDVSLNRPVAVKQWIIDESMQETARKLYLNEARTLAAVHHPNIVDIFAVLDRPEGIYLVFEMVSGKTVEHILVERKRFTPVDAARILRPAAEALQFAHENGVVHRDVKPSNLMLTESGYVKVMDFGIARGGGEDLKLAAAASPGGTGWTARTRTMAGTPEYMAPEAAQGLVSPGLDVYGLGVTLHEMLTGTLPTRGADGRIVRHAALSPEAAALIDAALEADPARRIPSAKEFSSRLGALAAPAEARA